MPRTQGTRFLLYPQYDAGFEPEIVELSAPAGSIRPGPSDARMYVADAVDKAEPYDPPGFAPPFRGPVYPPAEPDARGHFDTIRHDAPQFRAAHLFGMVRHTLEIWERAAGQRLHWWHPEAPARLELIPLVRWRNAQSGPGFLETGTWQAADAPGEQLFVFNHDVVAHETGHAILYGTMGAPEPQDLTAWYFGLHESFADLTAVVTALHFRSVRRRLLDETHGNLYALNLINRLGKVAPHQQLRLAANKVTLADVAGVTIDAHGNWLDPLGQGREAHALADPLTGAMFDVFVELYQQFLVQRGVIPSALDARRLSPRQAKARLRHLREEHALARDRFPEEFDLAVADARDALKLALVAVARSVSPAQLSFDRVATRVVESLLHQGHGALLQRLTSYFTRRGIDPLRFMRFRSVARQANARPGNRRFAPVIAPGSWRAACRCGRPWHLAAGRTFLPHTHRQSRPAAEFVAR